MHPRDVQTSKEQSLETIPGGNNMNSMRKKVMAGTVAAVIGLGGLAAAPVDAAPGGKGACVKAGTGVLTSLGLMSAAARQQVNYALIDQDGPGIPALGVPGGLINAQLGDEAFLPLSTVIGLHRTNPELFAWC
jgi:hypothetical protein